MGHTERANVVSKRIMTVPEAAYIAGLLDGEGHIGLLPRTGRKTTGHFITPLVRISNTNLPLLERVVEMTGNGRIVARTVRQVRQKQCYDWMLTANQIRHVLPQVLPFLVSKKRQAECLIRYLELVNGSSKTVPPGQIAEVVALCDEVRILNSRGVWTAEEIRENLLEITRRCAAPNCLQRPYQDTEYCYPHWLTNRLPNESRCDYCGGPMNVLMSHKRFCSQDCQLKSYRDKTLRPAAAAVKAAVEPGKCPECGTEFDRQHYKSKTYCSAACYQKMANRKRAERTGPVTFKERECAHCGGTFTPESNTRIYCGTSCRMAAYYVRKQQRE